MRTQNVTFLPNEPHALLIWRQFFHPSQITLCMMKGQRNGLHGEPRID